MYKAIPNKFIVSCYPPPSKSFCLDWKQLILIMLTRFIHVCKKSIVFNKKT